MTSSTEYGYLGTCGVESGPGLSRQPTMSGPEPVYTSYLEGAWANELMGSDGRLRYLFTGRASGRGVNNVFDTVLADNFTMMALVRPDTNGNFAQFMQKGNYNGTDFIALCATGNAFGGPIFNLKRSPANGGSNPVGQTPGVHRKPQAWQWVTGQRINNGGTNTQLTVWANADKRVGIDGSPGSIQNDQLVFIDTEGSKVRIACFLIFSRVLADTEIRSIIAGTTMPKTVPGLVGYYKFNEIEGFQCTDYSGAGNHLAYAYDICKVSEEYAPDGNIARAFNAAWTTPTGFTTGGGKLYLNNPAISSGADRATAGMKRGLRYKVSFTISDANATTAVRINLYAQDAQTSSTQTYTANGTYTETIMLGASAGSRNGTILVQVQNATTVCTISNLSVVPESAVDLGGMSGQPYLPRVPRSLASAPANMFRLPPSLAGQAAQGSLMTGIGTTLTVADSPSMRIQGDHTICGWVKLIGNNMASLWSKNTTEGRFDVAAGGKSLTLQRNGVTATQALDRAIPTTTWAFVGATWSAGVATFFVNAVPVGAQPFTPGAPAFTAAAATIGANNSSRPTPVRSVRLFNRALSATEMESLFWTDNFPRGDLSLVGEWLGNELWSGQVRDTSTYGNHGTINPGLQVSIDSPYWYPRRKNAGKQLGMASFGWLTVPGLAAALNGAGTITLTGKAKTPAAMASQPLLTLYAPTANKAVVWLYRNAAGLLQGFLMRATQDLQMNSGSSRINTCDALWHQYAIEFNCVGKTVKIYFDGVLVFSGPINTTAGAGFDLTGESALRIAFLNSATAVRSYYDDLRIYSRALADDEHRAIFLGRAPRAGLVAEYAFDNDVSSALDTSGNAFHATWSGVSLSDYVQIA